MIFSFEARVVLTLDYIKEIDKSEHVSTDFNLDIGNNLDKSSYLDSEGLLTKDGSNVLSNVLIQGLIGNIHLAHQKEFRDSAEHLKWIVAELERGFIEQVEIEKSTF